jgi:formylglycine-generating enzyme required for sulfatase activity
LLTEVTAKVEPKSGLEFVLVPGGTFRMGCESQDTECFDNEKPAHPVSVGEFWLGMTDVTVAAYAKCVQAGACEGSIQSIDTETHACNWKNGRMDHPMNCIKWDESERFCRWVGGRLPTAEEWERAAKGGEDRVYPWGDQPPNGALANFCDKNCPDAFNDEQRQRWTDNHWIDYAQDDGYAGTSPVGVYPSGASKWGLLDMSGNVWQWTASNYDATNKEVRGGGWAGTHRDLRASYRYRHRPSDRLTFVGFRCGL